MWVDIDSKIKSIIQKMLKEKNYYLVVATIFLIIALLHLLRVTLGWSAVIGGWELPFWLSWVAIIVASYLAYEGFKFSKK